MRDASAFAVGAIAVVLVIRAVVGHRYRRARRINITIEWNDGNGGAKEPRPDPPEGSQDGAE